MALDDGDAQPIKRAPVVYGKHSSNNLPPSLVVPVDEQADAHPSRTFPLRQARSLNASDTEHSPSPAPATPFQFGFRHRLRELDERFDDHGTQFQPGSSSDNKVVRVDPSQVKGPQSIPMGTPVLGPRSSGDLSHSSSPTLTSLPATSTQEYPPDSPVHQRARRVHGAPLSDSEAEESSSSSSVSPVRHAIITPHSRSSPTPPTSGDITMVSRKAKGKAPVRDVLPLLFDDEHPSAAEIPSKSKKGRRSEPLARTKIKAPTKKERREAAFESSRIAASRPVEVIRTQEQKHTLSAFFAGLRKDNIVTPTLGAELSSDPIERFSSPTDNPTRVEPENNVFGAPTGLLGTSADTRTIGRSFSSENSKAFPLAATDSEDEMPSIVSIIQQAGGKRQRLQAIKRVALQHADKTVGDDSEDDDLLIVKDDMHSVARQEAVQRRLDKAHGSPVKDLASLRRINHPSVRPIAISPHKLSRQELQELAKPSFARTGKRARGQLNKNQLDQLMMMKHTEEQLRSIKQQEEEWVQRGGRLSRNTGGGDTQNSLSQTIEIYAEQGLKAVDVADMAMEDTSADGSDEDYNPSLRGSASPGTVKESGIQDDNMEAPPALPPAGGDEDDEFITLRRNKHTQRRRRVVVGSDDEELPPDQSNLHPQKDATSSMESQTEDENDKENSAKLMYDRSEDKENKAIVRHESFPDLASVSRPASLRSIEDGTERSLSLTSVTDLNYTIGSPKGLDFRLPLKDISKDENDLFLSPPLKSLFTDRLLQSVAGSPPHTASTLSLGLSPTLSRERIGRIDRPLDVGDDENDSLGFKASHSSSLERLGSQTSPEPSPACLNPFANGGFSQLFSAEDQSSKKSDHGAEEGLALTLDVGLRPALEVGSTLRRRAETIFEKEQEYVVAAVVRQNDKPKELLYVNDHGFLTQTRPEGSSPQIYRMTPSQATKFTKTQVDSPLMQSLDARPPLRTLSFTVSQETFPGPQPLRRLRRRSLSPLEQKTTVKSSNPAMRLNAFSVLGKGPEPLPKEPDQKYEKSEFVAVEAEESDDDDMFGFGGPKNDDEEEENNEQDKVVEGLVDDTVMDAKTEAADLVQEKYREHEEEDDQRLQKLHEDATKGKFRIKRRDRGVGFEDDSDEDEDEDEHRIRQRIYKKRKVQDDNLEALGQNKETRAFYDTYHQDLTDRDDEFGYLRGDASIPQDDGDAQAEEPQETVSTDEIRRRVREVAANNYEVEVLDLEDTSWVDQAMANEADEAVPIKMVECRQSKPIVRLANMDFDYERSIRHIASEEERKQMTSWAKNHDNKHRGTGRSGNNTAVTGHTRAKSGGGSLRSTQPLKQSVSSMTRRTKTASLLSMVSNRSGKFS